MKNDRIIPILTLQLCKGFGIKRIKDIIKAAGSIEAKTIDELLETIKDIKVNIPEINEVRHNWIQAQKLIDLSQKEEIQIIDYLDEEYPISLKKLQDFPLLIHLKGDINLLNTECVSVVGTRNPSDTSLANAKKITKSLILEGYTIVSGLAVGIDTAAHTVTLENNGKTISVLAHGLHMVFPPENKDLSKEIVNRGGLLLSEYYYGQGYNKGFFIQRDRLQCGLSMATFVIETSEKGGTMHTAEFSYKQGRPVFVVEPSTFLPINAGNFKLIKEGAIPIGEDFQAKDMEILLRNHQKIGNIQY